METGIARNADTETVKDMWASRSADIETRGVAVEMMTTTMMQDQIKIDGTVAADMTPSTKTRDDGSSRRGRRRKSRMKISLI